MKNFVRTLIFSAMMIFLSSTCIMAANADSVDVFDSGDLPGTYKGSIIKGISTDGGSTYPFDDNFTVECDVLDAQEQYVLLMVKTEVTPEGILDGETPYTISEENILYIDQKSSEADGTISFNVWPSSLESGVLLLGGSFDQSGLSSPIILGTVYLSGVTVSGTVTYLGSSTPNVLLHPAEGSDINGIVLGQTYTVNNVPPGAYTLNLQKIGHLRYNTSVSVSDVDMSGPSVSLKGGDTNSDAYINATDLSAVLVLFGSSGISNNGCDVNEDTYINASDLSVVLTNFGQSSI